MIHAQLSRLICPLFLVIATMVLSTGARAAGGENKQDINPLMAERWKTRPVVIIAPSTTDPVLTAQQDVLQLPVNQAALRKREMVVYTVVGDLAQRDGELLSVEQARALRKALDVKDGAPATVFLVGKDGGTKLARRQVVGAEELFGMVDAMPMMRGRD